MEIQNELKLKKATRSDNIDDMNLNNLHQMQN